MKSSLSSLTQLPLIVLFLTMQFVMHAQFNGGDGTAEDPFQIATPAQFDSIRYYLDANYIITKDISISKWKIIGDGENPFTGSLNGQGFTISASIDKKGYSAIFYHLEKAEINNINLISYSGVTLTVDCNNSRIENCSFTGSLNPLNAGADGVGGFLQNISNSEIDRCKVYCSINAIYDLLSPYNYYGAICGFAYTAENSTISNCDVYTNLKGGIQSAGFISEAKNTVIKNCNLTGELTITSPFCGGFMYGCNTSVIYNCTSSLANHAPEYIQYQERCPEFIYDASNVSIQFCLIKGKVNTNKKTGELFNSLTGLVSNSYSLVATRYRLSGSSFPSKNFYAFAGSRLATKQEAEAVSSYIQADQSDSTGVMKSYLDMRTQETYEGWDFDHVWRMSPDKNDGLPYLDLRIDNLFDGGSGTVDDPYQVSNIQQLRNIEFNMGAHYILTDDIYYNIDVDDEDGFNTGWTPIGGDAIFFGHLNGNNHFIANLDSQGECRLFSTMLDAEISNLAILDHYAAEGISTNVISHKSVNSTIKNVFTRGKVADSPFQDTISASDEFISKLEEIENRYEPFEKGRGTEESPYEIATVADLYKIRFYNDKYFILTNDIDFNGTIFAMSEGRSGWDPIGTISAPFVGNIDGKGFSLKNLYVNLPENTGVGLFAAIDNSNIRNINFDNAFVSCLSSGGALAGSATLSEVSGINVSGRINGESNNIGGIVGNDINGIIKQCSSESTVAGNENVGGIAGSSQIIEACFSRSDVKGRSFIGGITGENSLRISMCRSESTVNAYQKAGGIAGAGESIVFSSNYGTVSVSEGYAAGIVGYSDGTIAYSYNLGLIKGNELVYGIGGYQIFQCYSAGKLGSLYPRNISVLSKLGWYPISTPVNFNSSYYDSTVLGTSKVYANFGRTTTEMQTTETYKDWDFDNIWAIDPSQNNGYPYLDLNVENLFAGGAGTSDDPYQIETIAQLKNIRYALDKNFILNNDVSFSKNVPEYWESIGSETLPFTGTLNGNGHSVRFLKIDSEKQKISYSGLFGGMKNAHIYNLGVEDVYIEIQSAIGVIAGYAYNSVIDNCYTSGVAVVNSNGASCMIGRGYYNIITNSYSDAVFTSSSGNYVVEAFGCADVLNCYYNGQIGEGSRLRINAFYSSSTHKNKNSYYDSTKITVYQDYGIPLDSLQMTQKESYVNWDFDSIWRIDSLNGGRPYLFWQKADTSAYFAGGKGTKNDPYLISTLEMLNNVRMFPDKHYALMNDLDFENSRFSAEKSDIGFESIGTAYFPFTGSFNGRGHIIKNLYINSAASRNEFTYMPSLFGSVQDATIDSLGLENVQIAGPQFVAGIASFFAKSAITNCFVTGNITGGYASSGLSATAGDSCIIKNSYSICNITGSTLLGGIVGGANEKFRLINSYSSSSLYSISGSFADTEKISGLTNTTVKEGTVNSYYNYTVSNLNHTDEYSRTEAEMQDKATFVDWDFAGADNKGTWIMDDKNGGMPHFSWHDGAVTKMVSIPLHNSITIAENPKQGSLLTQLEISNPSDKAYTLTSLTEGIAVSQIGAVTVSEPLLFDYEQREIIMAKIQLDADGNKSFQSLEITLIDEDDDREIVYSDTIIETCESVLFGGQVISESGVYRDTVAVSANADSIAVLYYVKLPDSERDTAVIVYNSRSYIFGNQTITKDGHYKGTFRNSNGCDSIVYLTIEFASEAEPDEYYEQDLTICSSEPFEGVFISESGIYQKTYRRENQSDSIVNYNITVHPAYKMKKAAVILEGETFVWKGKTLTETGVYSENRQTIYGCDSIAELALTTLTILTEPVVFSGYGDTAVLLSHKEGRISPIILLPDSSCSLEYEDDLFFIENNTVFFKHPNKEIALDTMPIQNLMLGDDDKFSIISVYLSFNEFDVIEEDINVDIKENTESGTLIAKLQAINEKNDSIQYELIDLNNYFQIKDYELQVNDETAFDAETDSTLTSYLVTDVGAVRDTFAINAYLININDNPVVIEEINPIVVSSTTENNTIIATIKASDLDNDTLFYEIELITEAGNISPFGRLKSTADLFSIDPLTGELSITDISLLNFDTQTTYLIDIRVSDGIHEEYSTVSIQTDPPVAIADKEEYITLYPNPSSNKVYITIGNCKEIEIYNTFGQKFQCNSKINNGITEIEISTLCKGYYTVIVISKREIKKGYFIKN